MFTMFTGTTLDMIDLCRKTGIPEPELEQRGARFVLTIRRKEGRTRSRRPSRRTSHRTSRRTFFLCWVFRGDFAGGYARRPPAIPAEVTGPLRRWSQVKKTPTNPTTACRNTL